MEIHLRRTQEIIPRNTSFPSHSLLLFTAKGKTTSSESLTWLTRYLRTDPGNLGLQYLQCLQYLAASHNRNAHPLTGLESQLSPPVLTQPIPSHLIPISSFHIHPPTLNLDTSSHQALHLHSFGFEREKKRGSHAVVRFVCRPLRM